MGGQDRGENTTLTVTDTITDGKAIYRYRNLTEAKILLLLGPGCTAGIYDRFHQGGAQLGIIYRTASLWSPFLPPKAPTVTAKVINH